MWFHLVTFGNRCLNLERIKVQVLGFSLSPLQKMTLRTTTPTVPQIRQGLPCARSHARHRIMLSYSLNS